MDVGVVPTDGPFRCLVVVVGRLVGENGVLFQGHKAVGETGRNPEHVVRFGGKQGSHMLSVGGGAFADVHRHVHGPAGDDAHQFALGEGWLLEVQPPDHIFGREGLVVLHKIGGQAGSRQLLLVVTFKKITPCVAEHFRLYDFQFGDNGIDDFHVRR